MINYYIVYLTVNINNNNLYIGVHKQSNVGFDGYIGCGVASKNSKFLTYPKTPMQYAIKKHGYKAFKRHTLKIFKNEEEAYNFEAKLVDDIWLKRKDTYNATLGGKGGWSHLKLKVLQYSKNGVFVQEFESVSDAAMLIKSAGRTEIAISCKDLSRTSGGFHWRYKTSDTIPKTIGTEYRKNAKSVPILQYSKSGKFIAEYPSMRKAAKGTKANSSEISRVAKNGAGKSGGYFWRYKISDQIPKNIIVE